MITAHVCQDDFGMWFYVVEEDDGTLRLHSHAGTREDMIEEAERDTSTIRIEDEQKPYPPGGLAPGYEKPEPRKAVV